MYLATFFIEGYISGNPKGKWAKLAFGSREKAEKWIEDTTVGWVSHGVQLDLFRKPPIYLGD